MKPVDGDSRSRLYLHSKPIHYYRVYPNLLISQYPNVTLARHTQGPGTAKPRSHLHLTQLMNGVRKISLSQQTQDGCPKIVSAQKMQLVSCKFCQDAFLHNTPEHTFAVKQAYTCISPKKRGASINEKSNDQSDSKQEAN